MSNFKAWLNVKCVVFNLFVVLLQESTGKYIVLYNYSAQDENDLSVERGQCVTVLNTEDGDWFWVAKLDGAEGFVPAGFIYPLDAIQRQCTDSLSHPLLLLSIYYTLSGRHDLIYILYIFVHIFF